VEVAMNRIKDFYEGAPLDMEQWWEKDGNGLKMKRKYLEEGSFLFKRRKKP